MTSHSSKPGPFGFKKRTHGEAISIMVNEKINIDSDDEMDLEIERETASNEKSECKSKTSGTSADGWNEVTLGNKKPKIFKFTKNTGPKFNLLPAAGSMDFGSFFNDKILNNTVIETEKYRRDKMFQCRSHSFLGFSVCVHRRVSDGYKKTYAYTLY
jgi:hypothetical protein